MQFKIAVASLTLAVSCAAVAQTPAKDFTKGFVGSWAGQLETQDSGSKRQVIDPMWLTITEGPDHKSLELDAIPYKSTGAAVHRSILITFDRDTAKAAFSTNGVRPLYTPGTYDLQGLKEFEKEGRGTLILTGTETEYGKPVDVRITLTLERNLYTYNKKSRKSSSDGHDDITYEAYTFTRRSPVSPKGKPLLPASSVQNPVQASRPTQPIDINANFVGEWVGQVTYADTEHTLKRNPTYLKIGEVRNGETLRMDFAFNDDGWQLNHELRFITIMPKESAVKLEWNSAPFFDEEVLNLDGLQEFSKTGYGTLIFTRADGTTEVRYTLILAESLLIYQREVRPDGNHQFETRNRYVFTRDSPRNLASSTQPQVLAN
ncbi:MAG TPA: hypothetical protein VIX42_06255 [Edaphobacter sp.]